MYKTGACCGEYQEEKCGVEEDTEWPDRYVCERGDSEYKVGRWSVSSRCTGFNLEGSMVHAWEIMVLPFQALPPSLL